MTQDIFAESTEDFTQAFKHLSQYMNIARIPSTAKELGQSVLGMACVGIAVTATVLDIQREATDVLVARADAVLHWASEWCHNVIDQLDA